MLKDRQEELKRGGGALETKQGACRFCGQIMALEVGDTWKPGELDELATELCECVDATCYAMQKRRKENAAKAVEEQFGPEGERCKPEVLSLLEAAVNEVAEMRVNSVTADIGNNVKAKIGMNSKGLIKVEKTKTQKETREA